jgi:vitamin B12 transporter
MRSCLLPVILSLLALGFSVGVGVAPVGAQEGVVPASVTGKAYQEGTMRDSVVLQIPRGTSTPDSVAVEPVQGSATPGSIAAPAAQEAKGVTPDTLTKAEATAGTEAATDSSQFPMPSYRMGEIFVTAAKLTGALEKMPAAVFVVQRPEIEATFDKTVVGILEEKEGINSGSYGSFGALELISLRGGRFGSVPTLLDGITINNEQNGDVDFNSIPSSMLERIEVLRGPLGLLHGGNGVVGVVNFVTAEPGLNQKPVARIGLSSGSFAYRKHTANFARHYGKLGTFFGIEGATSDGVGAYRDYSGSNSFGKLNYDFGKKRKVTFLISSYSGELRTIREAKQKSNATRLQLVSPVLASADSRLELRAFHSTEKTDYKDPYVTTLSDLVRYGATADFYKYGTLTGDVACGGGFTRSALECEDALSSWNPKTWEGYVFAEDELALVRGLKGLVSIRADRHSTFGTEVSPCACVWREMDNGKVWFSSGRGFNPPTLNDLFWPTQITEWEGWKYVTKGNEKLRAESSWMTELGSELSFFENSVRADVSCYVSRTSDFVQWTSEVSLPDFRVTYTPLNTEQVDARGLEAGLGFAVGGKPLGGVNLTLQRVEDGKGESLPYMPQTRANFWFARGFEPLSDLVVNVSVDATYVDRHLEPLGSSQGPFLTMEGKLSASLAGFTAFARLRNATNEYYPSRNLEFAPGQKGPQAIYYPMPGRNYDVGILLRLLN